MTEAKNKLLIVDGHSILNRAFYGVPDLSNSAFTQMLFLVF